MTIWFNTMRIKVTVIALILVPHNRKSKNTIYISTSVFYILFDIRIGNVSCICPAQTIVPFEHCVGIRIFWGN